MSFGDTSDDASSDQEPKCQRSTIHVRKGRNQDDRESQNGHLDLTALPEPPLKKRKVESKNHKCTEIGCGAVFSRPYRLKSHIALHHEGEEKPFKCSFEDCGRKYSSQSHLKRHELQVHIGEDDNSEEVLCGEEGCGLILSNKHNLKRHITRVHVDLPFECQVCSEKFRRKNRLNVHKVEVHNEEAPYKCSDCPKAFIHLHQYRKHQSHHKTYKCDCDEIFGKWTEYLKHKRTSCALPKTQYTCAICNKTFALKQNLTQHCLHIHLPDSRIEEFNCPYLDCNRSYKYKKNLQFHINTFHDKIFTLFNCTAPNCKKVLKSQKNLKQHLRLCHSDKPLKEKVRRKPRKDKGISNPRQNANSHETKKVATDNERSTQKSSPNNKLANGIKNVSHKSGHSISNEEVPVSNPEGQSSVNAEERSQEEGCKAVPECVEDLGSVTVVSIEADCNSASTNNPTTEGDIVFDFPEFSQSTE